MTGGVARVTRYADVTRQTDNVLAHQQVVLNIHESERIVAAAVMNVTRWSVSCCWGTALCMSLSLFVRVQSLPLTTYQDHTLQWKLKKYYTERPYRLPLVEDRTFFSSELDRFVSSALCIATKRYSPGSIDSSDTDRSCINSQISKMVQGRTIFTMADWY